MSEKKFEVNMSIKKQQQQQQQQQQQLKSNQIKSK
jgi:hypothetical protein